MLGTPLGQSAAKSYEKFNDYPFGLNGNRSTTKRWVRIP
nr:MAG TPA: hypothetical protein [Caudoviricetes sp.]